MAQNKRRVVRPTSQPAARRTVNLWLVWPQAVLLALIVPTYLMLRETSPDSWIVLTVKIAIAALTALWATVFAIAAAVDRQKQMLARLKAAFQTALSNCWLVATSLGALTAAEGLLAYELVGYRAIEVHTKSAVDALLNDQPGRVVFLKSFDAGTCEAAQPPTLRVPVGKHTLVFRSRASGEPIAFREVVVPRFGTGDPESITCIEEEEHGAERLH